MQQLQMIFVLTGCYFACKIARNMKTKTPPRMIRSGEESPALSDEQIDDARKLIGVWLRRDVHTPSVYEPLSVHDIRRWAHYSVGDDNPLFSEVDYAKRTAWGVVIAPPTFLYTIDSGIVAPGLPGIQWIFAGSRFENFLPVKAGDTITARARLIDVQIKSSRNVARYVNQVGEVIYTNQHGQVVTRYEGDIYRIPRKRSVWLQVCGRQGQRGAAAIQVFPG